MTQRLKTPPGLGCTRLHAVCYNPKPENAAWFHFSNLKRDFLVATFAFTHSNDSTCTTTTRMPARWMASEGCFSSSFWNQFLLLIQSVRLYPVRRLFFKWRCSWRRGRGRGREKQEHNKSDVIMKKEKSTDYATRTRVNTLRQGKETQDISMRGNLLQTAKKAAIYALCTFRATRSYTSCFFGERRMVPS